MDMHDVRLFIRRFQIVRCGCGSELIGIALIRPIKACLQVCGTSCLCQLRKYIKGFILRDA